MNAWWHSHIIRDVLLTYSEPRTYIEVGVAEATCYNTVVDVVQDPHGVDVQHKSGELMTTGTFYEMDSDYFFGIYEGEKPHVMFIDGDHSYEQVKKDFENALELIRPDGTIILHDTFPLTLEDTNEGGPGVCGDVYKLARDIELGGVYKGLNCYTYRPWPGLTLVQKYVPRNLT